MVIGKRTVVEFDVQDYFSMERTVKNLNQICNSANDFVRSASGEFLLDINDIKTATQTLNEFFEMVRLSDALELE